MYKRVERKRKRREEEEELGLDQDAKEIMGLNDTDSGESDSDSDPGISEDGDQEEDGSEDEDVDEDPPISVEGALRDPVYLVSLDPTVHGCVLCKGKLIKSAGTVTAHKNSKMHRRRFERFRLLSVEVDPHSNARDLVRTMQAASNVQRVESQEPSKRALKRQARQAIIQEKRKRHKELKAKAIAKKALKMLTADGKAAPSKTNLRGPPESQNQPGKSPKKQKLESKTTTSGTQSVTAKSASHARNSSESKKLVLKSRVKGTRKANKPS